MVSLTHPKSPLSSLHIFSTMNKSSSSSSSSSSSPSSSSSSSSPSSSSSLTTMKVKTLIHNLIFSHICRVIRALSKAKSIFLEIFKDNQLMYLKQNKKKNKYRKKILFGSFRLHYNWCSSSSHVLPIPSSPNTILEGFNTTPTSHHLFYDSTWNSVYATDNDDDVVKHHHDDDDDDDHHHHHHHHKVVGDHHACEGNANQKEEEDEVEGELSSYLQWLEEKGRKNENNNEEEVNNNINVENEIDKLADMFIANCHEKFRLEKIESYRRYQELLARSL